MASPSGNPHGAYFSDLVCLAKLYQRRTPGVQSAGDTTTILGEESEPQPDVFVRVVEECGGQSKVNEKRFVEGAPEFVAEVAHSSRSIDLNQKRRDYERYGVLEYLVFSVEDQTFHWFHFPSRAQLWPDRQGVYRSLVFPGLWIHARAFIAHDLDRWIGVLERGTSSRAHAAFVRRLERARRRHS
jgi:Uma2 family endonuclease